jgi:2-polyprenyl-3-methyl-5-hydroxy-6-metoxy-1,4-benzoquinol methylase
MTDYYNFKTKGSLDLNKDVCDQDTWMNTHDLYSCFKHDKGFLVFLKPSEIDSSDEYNESDPYTVIENIHSDFHQRRLNCTLQLIEKSSDRHEKKLLDIGCGQGHFTKKIKENFPDYKVYGLDYSISAIAYAHDNFKEVDFIVANAYNPPFNDECFDVVILNNIWEHVPDPMNLLAVTKKILKPNGQVIISTPSRYRIKNLVKALIGQDIAFMSDHHVTEYTVGQVKEQLTFGGFQLVKVYSPPIKEKRMIFNFLKSIVFILLKLVRSHHILEGTIFYSARKI